ncbi:50S ribosomal protein L25 [Calycomorphotria hydatis]|uniref:Large ribosomal subunit protein bL25 n=1 Tax=Calycomorphotria hydatis TaxID=2528027 RepID=A0A517TCY5_9PLAN|nr:50S ribosomal protein L25 [Calycomorphotria hydatis]QDT66231.1 50S ribosomal protein L25 [Calycomorphotria hydatis]
MAHVEKLAAEKRLHVGSASARRLRQNSIVPGTVYGHGEDPVAIAAPEEKIRSIIFSGHHVVELDLEGNVDQTLLKDVQWDVFGNNIIHFDLQRVSAKELIHVEVPVKTHGTAPGVVNGGILELPHHSLTVECNAINVPDAIEINIGELKIGATIHVSDLKLPEGVKVTIDPQEVVLHIVAPRVGGAEEEETEEVAAEV